MSSQVNLNGTIKSAVAFFVALFSLTACSSHSLNTYKGSVKDLLPEQVNNYKKGREVPGDNPGISRAAKGMNRLAEEGAEYSLNNKSLRFGVVVFDSPETASKVLQIFRLGASSEPGVNVKNAGEKKKGGSVVGERFEVEWLMPYREGEKPPVAEQIYWTNGSVLFSIQGGGNSGATAADVKAFEDALSY